MQLAPAHRDRSVVAPRPGGGVPGEVLEGGDDAGALQAPHVGGTEHRRRGRDPRPWSPRPGPSGSRARRPAPATALGARRRPPCRARSRRPSARPGRGRTSPPRRSPPGRPSRRTSVNPVRHSSWTSAGMPSREPSRTTRCWRTSSAAPSAAVTGALPKTRVRWPSPCRLAASSDRDLPAANTSCIGATVWLASPSADGTWPESASSSGSVVADPAAAELGHLLLEGHLLEEQLDPVGRREAPGPATGASRRSARGSRPSVVTRASFERGCPGSFETFRPDSESRYQLTLTQAS